jgi:NAD(P)-dependent dehydrogenase (short-subunit alcohol dehydrogenase family)
MVANAGIIAYESFQTSKPRTILSPHRSTKRVNKVTVEGFDRLMAVNARGTMLCYKHAGKQMIAQGRGGRIIGTHLAQLPFFIFINL